MVVHTEHLAAKNIELYGSTDMKVGVDIDKLDESKALLQSLLAVDPRGGLFTQPVVHTASDPKTLARPLKA